MEISQDPNIPTEGMAGMGAANILSRQPSKNFEMRC